MAGHNKWSQVKYIKARVDAVKGRVFSKCVHEIAFAARAGVGVPATNARLRTGHTLKLHDQLDDYPDTLNVFTNFEVTDEALEQLAS